jgi:hypothetical protein
MAIYVAGKLHKRNAEGIFMCAAALFNTSEERSLQALDDQCTPYLPKVRSFPLQSGPVQSISF